MKYVIPFCSKRVNFPANCVNYYTFRKNPENFHKNSLPKKPLNFKYFFLFLKNCQEGGKKTKKCTDSLPQKNKRKKKRITQNSQNAKTSEWKHRKIRSETNKKKQNWNSTKMKEILGKNEIFRGYREGEINVKKRKWIWLVTGIFISFFFVIFYVL